jgi:hypothetical protein
MTQVLAAFIAIPYGLSLLMRGSDGLNRGTYSSGEAGLLAGVGGALILTSLAMLLGASYAGILTAIALVVGLWVVLRRKLFERGRLTASDVTGPGVLALFLIALIFADI